MFKMKLIFVSVVLALIVQNVYSTMSEAQIKSAGKLLRNVCQPKAKVTNDQINAMHQGEFTENRELMCYMECVLRMGQIMKDGKLSIDSIHTQLASLPQNLAESAAAALEQCKDVVKSSEKCEAAYEFYKCYYEFNPANFFLP